MNKYIKNSWFVKYLKKRNPHFVKSVDKTRLYFFYRIDRVVCYLFYFISLKRKDSLKVVIFAQGRTGSTLLEGLICSTGYIKEGGEQFRKSGINTKYPYEFITGFSNRFFVKRVIFHLKPHHLTKKRDKEYDPALFLQKLQKDGWKIIYLQRENKLNH
ncbi:MAG: hypothetical protein GY834_15575, partial [Bacteroidetes bacterium]|nr:hypothetical protein [Bacteroidota bacterium]